MTPPTTDELLAACAALGLAPDAQIGWREVSMTQFSIARHYGGCTFNGRYYFYFPADDSLWRDDVVRAIRQARKAAKPVETAPEQFNILEDTKWPT